MLYIFMIESSGRKLEQERLSLILASQSLANSYKRPKIPLFLKSNATFSVKFRVSKDIKIFFSECSNAHIEGFYLNCLDL
jgi:hypothetical protein